MTKYIEAEPRKLRSRRRRRERDYVCRSQRPRWGVGSIMRYFFQLLIFNKLTWVELLLTGLYLLYFLFLYPGKPKSFPLNQLFLGMLTKTYNLQLQY